jgi:hypothetical protein
MDLRKEIIDRDNLIKLRGEPGRNRASDKAGTACHDAGASHRGLLRSGSDLSLLDTKHRSFVARNIREFKTCQEEAKSDLLHVNAHG